MVSDEIEEQEEARQAEREQGQAGEEGEAEQIVIKVLPLSEAKEVGSCPVCTEDFDQFFKQVNKSTLQQEKSRSLLNLNI